MSVGKRIRELRMNKGMTQRSLAEKLGKSPSILCEIEKGKYDIATNLLPIVADALDVEIKDLFFAENVRDTRNNKTG